MFSSQMNPLRRLSACLSEEAGGPEIRQRRPHRHHHHHHHHRHKKDYSVSPMGGNRPFSIPGSELPTTAVSNSTTSLESTKSSESRKKSSGKHTRFSLDGDLSSSSSSSSSGASGGVAISGRSRRATEGSSTTVPIITTTPPTPSPLEQARRRNTTSFGSDMGPPRVPYPVFPPAVRSDTQDYVAYPDEPSALPPKPKEYVAYHPSSEPKPIVPPKPVKSRESHTGAVEIGSSEITRDRSHRQRPPLDRVKENQYDFLRTFDTVFIIDDSASMADDPPHHTRWTETRCALETIATIATLYDADGIDIHFLNSTHLDAYNVTSAAAVRSLFDRVEPRGCTPTAECLDRILRPYLDRYVASKHHYQQQQQQQQPMYSSSPESVSSISSSSLPGERPPKPLNIVVLTDGSPTDDPESVIVSIAKQLDSLNAPLSQVGIQFFQIGDDEDAAEALEELDDRLAAVYGIRDMVDYTPFYNEDDQGGRSGMRGGGEGVLKVLCGAINRRVDRWENERRD